MASGDENESLGYAGYMWEPEYSKESYLKDFLIQKMVEI